MSEREELAGIIAERYHPSRPRATVLDGKVADAILAAGWSRPRVVSTVEELDALPGGSIVAAAWATHQKVLGAWVTFGGPGTTTPELPATVIFEATDA
uniref:hypothetical protein n=1 Tax=Arthrobacter silvisoli TaxID=2291022 RepID=UPI003F492B06